MCSACAWITHTHRMLVVRPPTLEEQPLWAPLWQGYLAFYGHNLKSEVTALTWQRFHDPDEPLFCRTAWLGSAMVGFATYVLHRSTWTSAHYCYLEDLFVAEGYRGQGVARHLINDVNTDAKRRGCARLYWVTRDSNTDARTLYDKLAERTDFVQYRMPLA
jgi:GNAT superfamily N-acetyltransferase